MSEQSRQSSEMGNEPTSIRNADPPPIPQNPPGVAAVPPEKPKANPRRNMLLGALGVLILAAALWFGIPWVQTTLNTVSTDDAYVNGHVTFVAARVKGQVSRVLVDDNYRVRKGDLLVQLDKEPFQIAVAIKKAAVDTATADLQVARSKVRGIEAEAMSRRRALEHAIENVDDQVALLRAKVAGVDKSKAELALAQVDFDRAAKLVVTNDTPKSEYDRRQAILLSARADVVASLADVRQIRASLGLPPETDEQDLGQVPPDLNQTFSSVLQAQAALIQSAAQLGVIHSFDEGPRHMVEAFEKEGDVNTTFARLAADAPDIKQAEAKLEVAKRDLDQAELDLRYCDVFAEIDGVITRRNVNPGDNIQVGQALMAIRSLNEIWVDANFKETQLGDLRIGQPVDLYVDMYGDRHVFKGRISGFTEGTGSTLALLPAENATGNFIKVVQRLPVRIDLENYDPDKSPLFVGTSVVPYVYFNKPPTGPDARKFLQTSAPQVDCKPAGRKEVTAAALSPARPQVARSPWLVAVIVVVPAFMEVLDTTIVLVALRYIAGGLSAAADDAEWVITSYLAANAFILPITGWLSAHLGRRNYFLASIAIFTLSSLLCGLAGSLAQLILFRVIQGLAGGGLQPGSQGILLDAFPRERQGVAMTMFGLAVLIAPIVGPTLGGWITDTYNWRWCFLINVPVGILAFIGCYFLLRDPDYLVAERKELRKQPFHFDAIGLSLLAIVIVSWEVMLSKGQEWDWLGDPFWRVQTLVISLVVGLVALIFWELRHRNPVVNFRALGERNFAACCVIIFCAYLALFAGTKSLLGLLQTLFGYDALKTGLVMSPSGIFAVLAMPIVGRLIGLKVDARWLIAVGLLLMTAGNYWMSQLNLDISPSQVVWPRVLLVLGLSVCFAPANVAAYLYTPLAMRGAAIGILSLLRNEGGSVGVSLSQTFQERRDQFHVLRLGEYLDPFNAAASSFLARAEAFFVQQNGDPAASQQLAVQQLDNLRQQQASSLAYFDTFWMAAVLTFVVTFAVLFMKRSVAEKGARAGPE